jgi:hypothetical protein
MVSLKSADCEAGTVETTHSLEKAKLFRNGSTRSGETLYLVN